MHQCAICQGSFSERELEFHEKGKVCGMCALESEVDVDASSLGGVTKPLVAAVVATALGNAVSMRTSSLKTVTFPDSSLDYGRTEYSANVPALVGGGLGMVIAIVAITMGLRLGADVATPKKAGAILLAALVLLWAGYTLYTGIPYVEDYGNWPENPRI